MNRAGRQDVDKDDTLFGRVSALLTLKWRKFDACKRNGNGKKRS